MATNRRVGSVLVAGGGIAGIHPDRASAVWVSGAEGPRFARKVTEFTETIRALGPNRFGKVVDRSDRSVQSLEKKEVAPCR